MVKLFAKRPPEVHPALTQLFVHFKDNPQEDIDVLTRTGYYYNMLKDRLSELRQIFDEERSSLRYKDNMSDCDVGWVLMQPKFLKFNSLAIIYLKPAEAFTKPFEYFMNQRNKEKALKMDEDEEANINTEEQTAPPTPAASTTPANGTTEVDLIGGAGVTSSPQVQAGNLSEEDLGRCLCDSSSEGNIRP